MSFSYTSRNIRLDHFGYLRAECSYQGVYYGSLLHLNDYIGIEHGSFTLAHGGFINACSDIELLNDHTMSAKMWDDQTKQYHIRKLDLNMCVANIRGELSFQPVSECLLNAGWGYKLNGCILSGFLKGSDGLYYYSTINLNNHFSNHNGSFRPGDNNFFYTASNIYILVTQENFWLVATLNGAVTKIDLLGYIHVHGGSFVYEASDGFLQIDGVLAKFFESVPGVGFLIAGIDVLSGNRDEAIAAVARCFESTYVLASGLVGSLVGGPAGAAVMVGLMTPFGICMEAEISSDISDPYIRGQFEKVTFGRVLFDTLFNMVGTGVGKMVSDWLGETIVSTFDLESWAKVAGKQISGTLSENGIQELFNELKQALEDGVMPEQWKEVQNLVKAKSKGGAGSALLDDWFENGINMKSDIKDAYSGKYHPTFHARTPSPTPDFSHGTHDRPGHRGAGDEGHWGGGRLIERH